LKIVHLKLINLSFQLLKELIMKQRIIDLIMIILNYWSCKNEWYWYWERNIAVIKNKEVNSNRYLYLKKKIVKIKLTWLLNICWLVICSSSMSSYPFRMLDIIFVMSFLSSDAQKNLIDVILYQSRRFFIQDIRLLPILLRSNMLLYIYYYINVAHNFIWSF
jgi:hypothetical protein